ncbi:MAG TPA: HAD family hydrolase [Acidimicrobiales bacterium]|nr:HAD family hydrolase [Acidimicrobiales bacterium]
MSRRSRCTAAHQQIRLALFDVGGPIYDDEYFFQAVHRAACEISGQDIPEEALREVYDEVRQRQAGGLRSAIAERFAPGRRADLVALSERYWTYPADALFDDVIPTVKLLSSNYELGLAANQPASTLDALRRDGLLEYFRVQALSCQVGIEKPDAGLFRYALEQAGVEAQEAVHIGNRLDNDIRPAAALGLRTVWVLRGEAPPAPTPQQLAEPDATVTSLTELPAVLERLPRGWREEVALQSPER